MTHRYRWLAVIALAGLIVGCATKKDFQRLESKVDLLVRATNRTTLDEIFGEQASEITLLVNNLDSRQKRSFESLQQEYVNGALAVADVRQRMLSVLGNNDRIVSTRRGIYIRNLEGAKLKAIPIDTKIANCSLLDPEDIPPVITGKKVLNRFSWGRGELGGKTVLFPWELTISSFTKEVAEHTARRTAEEFIKMGGEKKWQRPIQIQISTEKEDRIKVSTSEEESEIYFNYGSTTPENGVNDASAMDSNRGPEDPGESAWK